ncbi:calcium-binding protein [Thetidibacter halocola]|uniref:Calcium-binding protein n=1 Tax=Thetidibacter halocola TaxID=2827239 RepID=A0A8J7WCY7_9RHOB|nr:calcium-binding protein [Thetidibacter halocola]MBS0123396.1 calcium-binding protein [Thetidibacter halocola]
MIRRLLCILAMLALPCAALAERDSLKLYVFGNSLLNHLDEQADHTNVPHWLHQMARAEGRDFALDGQWGFPRGFADGLPPRANWSFPGVPGVWSPDRGRFGEAGFDTVLIATENFIQYQPADRPYDGDNPTGESPLGALLRLTDWVQAQSPGSEIVLYEGWSAMDGIVRQFPPTEEEFARYHAVNAGALHDWYGDLLDRLVVERPGLGVRLIPVAQVMAVLMQEGGLLANVPAQALFTDDAPHGTETLYLIAAAITYVGLFDAPPPADWRPPATLHPSVVSQWGALSLAIWQAMPRQTAATTQATSEAETPAETVTILPERQPVMLPPSGMRPEGAPALGMGLNGLADWSTQYPFIDLMKSARDWVGHLPGRWGGVSSEELRAGGNLDENGWPVSIPEGVERLESVLLTDMPEDAAYLRGDYVMLYDGQAEFTLTGRAKRVRYEPGRATFFYEPGPGLVGVSISAIPADDPMRNIRIVREDHLPLYEVEALFNPLWLETVQDMRVLRFMDWMMTNGSPVQTWEDRPRLTDATWTTWGVPLEVMIELANTVGADPWFTLPHMADDDYVRRFAETVKAGLNPRLKAHVEYSNEVWNRIFPQAEWAAAQAEARWGESDTGWAQFYGLRAAQVMDTWTEVYGPEADDRLLRVVATQTGWPGLEESILLAPLAFLQLGRPPQDSFDAYAVTGYFGYEMGGDEAAAQVDAWLAASEAVAEAAGQATGLRRVALREYVRANRFDAAIAPMAQALEEGSLNRLVSEVFPYHAGVARRAGLRLIMYEGGTHLVAPGARNQDERLTDFLAAFSYTPEMARLYEILLGGWAQAGGTLFTAFVDVAPATRWGSWGAKRHLADENPRWDILAAFNATGPNDWELRDAGAFAQGLVRIGGGQPLQGTDWADVLIGGLGDDVLVSGGGNDRLHGGPGSDRAVLPGSRGDYAFERDGALLRAVGSQGTVVLRAVEEVLFAAQPDSPVPADTL